MRPHDKDVQPSSAREVGDRVPCLADDALFLHSELRLLEFLPHGSENLLERGIFHTRHFGFVDRWHQSAFMTWQGSPVLGRAHVDQRYHGPRPP